MVPALSAEKKRAAIKELGRVLGTVEIEKIGIEATIAAKEVTETGTKIAMIETIEIMVIQTGIIEIGNMTIEIDQKRRNNIETKSMTGEAGLGHEIVTRDDIFKHRKCYDILVAFQIDIPCAFDGLYFVFDSF